MELTNNQIIEFNNSCIQMLDIEGSKYEFADAVIDLKNIYEPFAMIVDEKTKEMQKRVDRLKTEHCTRDNENKPKVIHLSDGRIRHEGLVRGQCEEFDEETDKLEVEAIALSKEKVNIDDEKFDKIRKLKIEQCPKAAMKVRHWEVIRQVLNE